MFNHIFKTVVASGALMLSAASLCPLPAIASSKQTDSGPTGFTLWNDGEMSGVAFKVWTRPARQGGGFYYFLWGGHYANITDHARPEVAVYFDSNIATVNGSWLVDCYNNASSRSLCANAEGKPDHVRRSGGSIPAPLR